ncbi:hypothetical protein SAMN06265367_107183 [Algoriphagus winogradskyi]|uniref:Lipoprotein n=1 Tax=Algoriphagus winogradskyi TaxID=237017 RepID=A0ABY1PCW5_9BACT|nr:hypothetical protein SAMN06265367_107183 [Algoriphagus winogradskyi]
MKYYGVLLSGFFVECKGEDKKLNEEIEGVSNLKNNSDRITFFFSK